MSQIYRRLDQQQEDNRKSFEAINIRMDRMDDQLSFLCYSNQMANEQMLFPYQNTSRQFKEMEMQGIPVTMARQQHNKQEKQTKANQQKLCQIPKRSSSQVNLRNGKYSQRESERERLGQVDLRSTLTLHNLSQLVRDCRLNTHSKEPPCNRAFKVKKRTPKRARRTGWR
ncbi:hypothetical protein PIB30_067968 [Stylosanthes scabra]|uniref:Uncharacterized protein n=1 Tax=Stylosanthes scabra TaxID=79078 RepID=A0ABU6SNB4_9FABA|nr:hypothetical protein [Stylosanthes scabra]